MSRWRLPLLALAVASLLAGVGWGVGRWRETPLAPTSSTGALLYQVHCASCHGPEGRGDGSMAGNQRPRDFAARPWRFEPTPDSIKHVTRVGIPGAAMPAFGSSLSATDIDALAEHVHHLATQSPAKEEVPSENERLLRDAGFTDLRGAQPPPLTLTTSAGKTITLADLRSKLAILHFWGTGCVHCVKEIPPLQQLEKSRPGLVCLHVCTDEDVPAAAQKSLDRFAKDAVACTDTTGLGLARYEIHALPTAWLIAPDGKAIAKSTGARDWQSPAVLKLLDRWLPKEPVAGSR
ncbi:MAG TPA: c-type cytochrome [Gemmataceae bacterium]|nr:c-type cytochrome [Gemmataceae bacterium]